MRHELGPARTHGSDGRLGQGLGIRVPLFGQPRLDRDTAAIAVGDHVGMLVDLNDQALRLKVRQHLLPGHETVQALISLGRILVNAGLVVQHVDHFQIMAAANLEIIEIMRRRHLHRTRALFGIGIVIRHNDQAAPDQGQNGVLAHQILIARVIGVYRDGGVAQHGFGPRGGDGDELAVIAFERIFDVPQMAGNFHLLHFQVRNRRPQLRVPVDEAFVLVDQVFLVELDKNLDHRLGQTFIHGEAFTRPITRGAQALQLSSNGAARLVLPLPDSVYKFFPAQILARLTFFAQHPFDHHLCRDTRMIHAWLP